MRPWGQTVSFWQRQARRELKPVDVAVVGAGIGGASVAYWLRHIRPDWRVLVIERRHPAFGASGRNAGFLLQGFAPCYADDVRQFGAAAASELWRLTVENRDLLLGTFGESVLKAECRGSLTLAGSDEERVRLQASADLLTDAGIDARYLSPTSVHERMDASGFHGGLEVASGAVVDPVATVNSILGASRVEVIDGAVVEAITPAAAGCRIVCDRCAVEASCVVVAVNAWTPVLFPELSDVVVPRRAQMLVTEPTDRMLSQPVYSHDGYYYVRQARDGSVLVGGARDRHVRAEVGFDDAVTFALQADLSAYVDRHFAWASGLNVRGRWSGTMGFSPTRTPLVGSLTAHGPVTWLGGFSGHGMGSAFVLGRAVAERINGASPPILRHFDWPRPDADAA